MKQAELARHHYCTIFAPKGKKDTIGSVLMSPKSRTIGIRRAKLSAKPTIAKRTAQPLLGLYYLLKRLLLRSRCLLASRAFSHLYMKHSNTRPWVDRLVDWSPGFDSNRKDMAQEAFIATDAFEHRYAREEILRSTLEKPPLSFNPKDIIIRVINQLQASRKLVPAYS